MSDKWFETKEQLLEGLNGKQREITGALLENQQKYLTEQAAGSATGTSNIARFDKIAMPLVRRVTPATMALELVGNQPMSAPVGIVNTLRVKYSNNVETTNASGINAVTAGDEANGQNVYEKYSLIAAGEAYDASDSRSEYQQTLALESQGGYEMNLEIVKKSIEAKTRRLQAKWSLEADQDAKALHGVSLEGEMVSALSDEIIREQDRELLGTLSDLAGTVKTFDFALADGRYAAEKFTSLAIGISDLSTQIAVKTKRGGASWIVVSPNVLTALRHASNGSFQPATGDLNVGTSAFVGTYNGNVRVYVDIYANNDTLLMGYKGSSELDTGLIYSPYVPLMQSNVLTDPTTYNPQVSLMTRYALTAFTDSATDLGNSADYYARANITNLNLGFSA